MLSEARGETATNADRTGQAKWFPLELRAATTLERAWWCDVAMRSRDHLNVDIGAEMARQFALINYSRNFLRSRL